MKKKIIFVFGTRPEAIKLAPVIIEAKKHQRDLITKVLVTAQHRELLDDVLKTFKIKPDYDLNIMQSQQSLSAITAKILVKIEKILIKEKPNWAMVQGDTSTVLAASLACYYQKIDVAHVEAGLRSYNKYEPFPEEINRVVVSHISDCNFAPTSGAKENLTKEGIHSQKILVTGNTAIDALFLALKQKIKICGELDKIDFNKKIILITAHRRENFGKPLINICKALRIISELEPRLELVYPVHPNPNVRKTVELYLRKNNIKLIKPLDYLSFCHLMKSSYLILTDSGGIQEEAPSLNKPVLILRNVTERPEAVKSGAAILVGTNTKEIVGSTKRLLENETLYKRMVKAPNPFGDGKASKRIIQWIIKR